jgi:transcriptional regulator with XRE-family HTH domain
VDQKEHDLRNFGVALKRARQARGVSQEKLAELVSLSGRTVQRIEAGAVNVPFTTLLRLRRALGCPITSLFPSE